MKVRAPSLILGATYAALWGTFALYVLPTFRSLFADFVPHGSLPLVTRGVLSVGPAAGLLIAVCGGVFISFSDFVRPPRWQQAVIATLGIALGCVVALLFWPLVRLLESAA